MTVIHLNQPFTAAAPDPNIIRASRTELVRKLAMGESLYLPSLKQQLTALELLFTRLDDYVRQMLAAAPVALQTQDLSAMLEKMRNASALQPEALARSVVDKYDAEINDMLLSSLESMDEYASRLIDLLDNLHAWTLGEAASFITDHERQSASIHQLLDGLKRDCAELEQRKQQLNDAMQVYEEKTVLDRWTPILKDAARLNLTRPALATLQGAVIGVMHILDLASETVKYGDLVEARSRLQADLNAKYAQAAEHKRQIRGLESRNEQLRPLLRIAEVKDQYEQEVRKIAAALQAFLGLRDRRATEPASDFVRGFILYCQALSAWLKTVHKNWK